MKGSLFPVTTYVQNKERVNGQEIYTVFHEEASHLKQLDPTLLGKTHFLH